MNKQTFAVSIKHEITSESSFSDVRQKALLSAYLRINGVIAFKNKAVDLHLKTANSKVAKYIYARLKVFFPEENINLSFLKKKTQSTTYLIEVKSAEKVLEELNVDYLEGKISKEIAFNDDSIAGYLAGAFLACGSINSPKTPNYHLELAVTGDSYAKWLLKMILKYKKLELTPKITKRRDKYVLYLKKSDQIANFLIVIGAPECCMEFEGERVKRDYYNSENRLINFEIANMEKASKSGKRQAKEIKFIDDNFGVFHLHNPKKEALCYLRMEHKEASLDELATMLSDEFGQTITRNSVNHMLRTLHELYIKIYEVKKR